MSTTLAKSKLPCMSCKHGNRRPGGQKCEECFLRGQPVDVRHAAAKRRALAVPQPLHVARVPKEEWPAGRRWCSGCQTFVLLRDCGAGNSRCKTCASVVAHAAMVQRVYQIRDADGMIRPFLATDYDRLLQAQGGRCYICQERPRRKRLAVDHDHRLGTVRGLLCADSDRGCNAAILGNIKDLAMARRIVEYLERPPAERH